MATGKEFTWKSKDGLNLYARLWEPVGNPHAVISLVHGLGEHSGRYEDWAMNFTSEGYAVLAIDYRGHGKSDGKRGHITSYDCLLDDIEILMTESRKAFEGIPLILYGHSLGGNLVLNYVMQRPSQPDALIVTSPFLRHSTEPPALKLAMGRLFLHLLPSLTMGNGLHSTDLSHNKDVAGKYNNDPLVHNQISPTLYFAMRNAGEEALSSSAGIRIPVLLMHGSEDRITSYKASEEFAHKYNDHITFRLWEGLFHEIHNEPSAKEIFAFILRWLKGLPAEKSAVHGYF